VPNTPPPDDPNEAVDDLFYSPDMRELTGLYCFFDDGRVCGPACMAFVTHPKVAAGSELSKQQAKCVLMHSAERLGRNLVVLTGAIAGLVKDQQRKDADTKRQQQVVSSPFTSPFDRGKL